MTLLKGLSLGWAAGLVAGAQAADLPATKAAPATEYVKVCRVGGVTGFALPGSDACVEIGGFVSAEMEGGNLRDQFALTDVTTKAGRPAVTEIEIFPVRQQPMIGYSTRGELDLDALAGTAYGPLAAHIELLGNSGVGFQTLGNGVVINNAYLTWAGVTAGRHWSFYDFIVGRPEWQDFLTPDDIGVPTNLLAYTASFGGGFGATLSLEQPDSVNQFPGQAEDGFRSPDIVAALDVKQGWGIAHLAGVAHRDEVATIGSGTLDEYEQWGYGVIGGVMFNIPAMAGDDLGLQAAFAHAAIGYSGVASEVWDEGNTDINVNAIGTLYRFGDAYWSGGHWSTPDAWTIAAFADLHVAPTFTITPKLSYGAINYSGDAPLISKSATAFVGGASLDWSPFQNLDFGLDLIVATSHQSKPAAYVGPAFVDSASGFNGRLRITRNF